MIRVIYRWHVEVDDHEAFRSWWHAGTVRIRSSRPGALGSTLLRPHGDDVHFVAIARWESLRDLEAFWADPGGVGFPRAVLEATEVFHELDDLAVQ